MSTTLKGKKVAMLVEDFFEDLELWYPKLRLIEAEAEVVVIGSAAKEYHGKNGLSARADLAIRDTKTASYDALVIPGGYAPDHMRRHEEMIHFVREMHNADKVVAAICHAGWMLASADIVRDRTITSFFSIRDDMRNAGAEWVDREVVRDGNLITSRMPSDLPAFCRTIIDALG